LKIEHSLVKVYLLFSFNVEVLEKNYYENLVSSKSSAWKPKETRSKRSVGISQQKRHDSFYEIGLTEVRK